MTTACHTPRRIDSKLYHIYHHVREDLSRKPRSTSAARPRRQRYYLLGKDWLETARRWALSPPHR